MKKYNIFFIVTILILILSAVLTIFYGYIISMNISFLIFILISFTLYFKIYKNHFSFTINKYDLIYLSQIIFYIFYILDILIFKICVSNIKVLLIVIPSLIPLIIFFILNKKMYQ